VRTCYQVYEEEEFARIGIGVKSTRARLALGAVVALALLALFFRGVDRAALGAALRSADLLLLLGGAGTTVLMYVLRAWRWGYLLSPLARVPFPRLFSATVVGFTTALVVPRAGEIVRPYLVGRTHGVQLSAGFATIILERLFDLMTVLALFGLYLWVLPIPEAQARGPILHALEISGVVAGAVVVAILGILAAFHLHAERVMAVLDRLFGLLPKRLAAFCSRELRAFGAGLAVLKAPAVHLLAIGLQSVLLWLAIALGLHLNNRAFGMELPFHSTFVILPFLTVGVAIPTPGMVGGFHESFKIALTQVFGIDNGTAAAAGITSHALANLPVLLMGLPLLGRDGLTVAKVAKMAEEAPQEADVPAAPHSGEGAARRV
jgi:uncharacterized protein (TIRG00374 family)